MARSVFTRYQTLPLPTSGPGYPILTEKKRISLILFNAAGSNIYLGESDTPFDAYRRTLAPNDALNFAVAGPNNRLFAWADAAHDLHVTEVLP